MQRMYSHFYGTRDDGLLAAQQATPGTNGRGPAANEPPFSMASSLPVMSINEHLRSLPTPPLPLWSQPDFRHPQENDMLGIGTPKMHLPHQQTPCGSQPPHMSNRCDARVPSSSDTSSSSCSPSSSENIHTALQNALALEAGAMPMQHQMKQEPLDDYLPAALHHNNQQMGDGGPFPFGCATSSDSQQQTSQRRSRSSSEGMLKCQYCPKKFSTASLLEHHMHDCQLIRVHECSQCGKRFKARGGLQQHMRIHNNDRPYACHFCAKRFTQKSHVDQHERIHTGAKPFVCQYCGRAFRQRSQQLGHEATHIHAAQEIRPSVEAKPLLDLPPPDSTPSSTSAVTGLLALSQQQHLMGMGSMPSSMLHIPDFDHHMLGQIM